MAPGASIRWLADVKSCVGNCDLRSLSVMFSPIPVRVVVVLVPGRRPCGSPREFQGIEEFSDEIGCFVRGVGG